MRSPAAVGRGVQRGDVELAHREHRLHRASGARRVGSGEQVLESEVVMELTDQDYGSRDYVARDPEGNLWCFGTYRPEAA